MEKPNQARPVTPHMEDCDIYYINGEGKLSWKTTSDADNTCVEVARENERKESRLTVMRLDTTFKVEPVITGVKTTKPESSRSQISEEENLGIKPDKPEMPERYRRELDGFCSKCETKTKILWRNIKVAESRYESRFRSCPEKPNREACFLHYHTMQVPYLDTKNVILAMVHHVRIDDIANAQSLTEDVEKSFVCVLGLEKDETKVLLGKILGAYQENAYLEDPFDESAMNPSDKLRTVYSGITPKIFVASLLKYYGFNAAKSSIRTAFTSLAEIDQILENADWKLLQNKHSTDELRRTCNDLNSKLQGLTQALTGVRSRVHYIGLCARGMMREDSETKKYIVAAWDRARRLQARGSDSQEKTSLAWALDDLDSTKYTLRDNDKLDMISRAMIQYEVDIKSLKAHATIAVGLVANLYSKSLLDAAERDSSSMNVLAMLTILFLPATFVAIIITTPMVLWAPNFDPKEAYIQWYSDPPTVVGTPLIVWIVTSGSITLSILFCLWQQKRIAKLCKWVWGKPEGGPSNPYPRNPEQGKEMYQWNPNLHQWFREVSRRVGKLQIDQREDADSMPNKQGATNSLMQDSSHSHVSGVDESYSSGSVWGKSVDKHDAADKEDAPRNLVGWRGYFGIPPREKTRTVRVEQELQTRSEGSTIR